MEDGNGMILHRIRPDGLSKNSRHSGAKMKGGGGGDGLPLESSYSWDMGNKSTPYLST